MSCLRLSTLRRLLPLGPVLVAAACASTPSRQSTSTSPGNDPAAAFTTREELAAEVARLRVERDRCAETNAVLQDELKWAHEDLRLVERQFVQFEERLATDYGKASAVSAVAEARMRYKQTTLHDRALPDSTGANIVDLMNTADTLIRKGNYPAALFFAERANHTMISIERRMHLDQNTVSREVSVTTANVREGPGQNYAVLEQLSRGEQVVCSDSVHDWYHVRTPSGTAGWVHMSVLK